MRVAGEIELYSRTVVDPPTVWPGPPAARTPARGAQCWRRMRGSCLVTSDVRAARGGALGKQGASLHDMSNDKESVSQDRVVSWSPTLCHNGRPAYRTTGAQHSGGRPREGHDRRCAAQRSSEWAAAARQAEAAHARGPDLSGDLE